ncbi:MAG TPA: AraC family transcriptional regulator, partial [Verrucomicrobiaceae bacterium]
PEMEGSPRLVVTNKIPLRDVAGHIIGVAGFSRQVEQTRRAPAVMKKLAAAIDHLHKNYATEVATPDLARRAGLSVSQLERTFRRTLGLTPRRYLLRVRVENACRLLAETDETIAAIAIECGFYDHAHFTKAFTTFRGTTPSHYRREHQAPRI